MTKWKLLAACAALSTVVAATPSTADQVVHRHHVYNNPGPVGAAADTAAGIAGAAIGTPGAIATAPFRNSYNYDTRVGSAEYYDRHMSSAEFACRPGTWIKGNDGRRHICQ
jgi:hypothetical protein